MINDQKVIGVLEAMDKLSDALAAGNNFAEAGVVFAGKQVIRALMAERAAHGPPPEPEKA